MLDIKSKVTQDLQTLKRVEYEGRGKPSKT